MDRKVVRDYLDMLDECDYVIECEGAITTWQHSEGMCSAIMDAAIKRKNMLLNDLRSDGIKVEDRE